MRAPLPIVLGLENFFCFLSVQSEGFFQVTILYFVFSSIGAVFLLRICVEFGFDFFFLLQAGLVTLSPLGRQKCFRTRALQRRVFGHEDVVRFLPLRFLSTHLRLHPFQSCVFGSRLLELFLHIFSFDPPLCGFYIVGLQITDLRVRLLSCHLRFHSESSEFFCNLGHMFLGLLLYFGRLVRRQGVGWKRQRLPRVPANEVGEVGFGIEFLPFLGSFGRGHIRLVRIEYFKLHQGPCFFVPAL
mmetsp:Transcript_71447/g.108021  ORF Transcript_71447/g.108021 Transcript_71447/m.108021 type:complete len:243 (-) Transcript_71447:425-1153(-)